MKKLGQRKSEVNGAEGQENGRPFETVGAGSWIAPIWKRSNGDGDYSYRFTLSRMRPVWPGVLSRRFHPRDVLDLPKLTQVLAATLVADGCMAEGMKDDLACLASQLDSFLTPGVCCEGTAWVHVKRESLKEVIDYLWEDELQHFRATKAEERERHIFRDLVVLGAAANGTTEEADAYLDEPGPGEHELAG